MRTHTEVLVAAVCGGLVLAGAAAPAALASPTTPVAGQVGAAKVSGVVAGYTLVVPKSVSASNLQARVVIPNGVPCPKVDIVNKAGRSAKVAMTKRVPAATTVSAFASLRACQAALPKNLKRAEVDGHRIPAALPKTYKSIAMFGDTGCRVDDDLHQDCASPALWPLAANSKAIAKEKPDVAIFTGDFYYREARCGVTKTHPDPLNPDRTVLDKCGGSPEPVPGAGFNDTDYGWMADVFIPMAPVMRRVPILAIRGNHEECRRAGNGWFLFFDVSPLGAAACAPAAAYGKVPEGVMDPTWKFDMRIDAKRTLRTVIVDSANGRNFDITPWSALQRPAYQKAHRLSTPAKGRESWLVTHRPMFGVDSNTETTGQPSWNNWTAVDQTAAAYGLIGHYNALIASHVHVAQVVRIPGEPSQIVVGNGGSIPDNSDPATYPLPTYGPLVGGDGKPLANLPAHVTKPYPTAEYLWTKIKYGYVMAAPGKKPGKWTLTQKGVDGKAFATCSMVGKKTTCKK